MSGGPRVWLAAGEASGDRLAADLALELRRRHPEIRLRGLAGPAMRAVGVRAVARAEDATAIGLVEVVGALPRLLRLLRSVEADAVHTQPHVVITVDSPGLLLRLARRLRRRDLRVVHLVAPQFWAWRPGRARQLADQVDSVMCLLPFEAPRLQPHVRAVFVGHPAAGARPGQGLRVGEPTVALLPGSRPSEVARHWPVLVQVATRLRARRSGTGFVVARAPTIPAAALAGLDATIVEGVAACASADVAITASGTATLELAAMDVPMVVIYQVHPVTWAIGRRLVTGVEHLALPNVLAGRAVVPEILQDLDPDRIAAEAMRVAGQRGQVPRALIEALDGAGAIGRAADEVDHWLTRADRGAAAGS